MRFIATLTLVVVVSVMTVHLLLLGIEFEARYGTMSDVMAWTSPHSVDVEPDLSIDPSVMM